MRLGDWWIGGRRGNQLLSPALSVDDEGDAAEIGMTRI